MKTISFTVSEVARDAFILVQVFFSSFNLYENDEKLGKYDYYIIFLEYMFCKIKKRKNEYNFS